MNCQRIGLGVVCKLDIFQAIDVLNKFSHNGVNDYSLTLNKTVEDGYGDYKYSIFEVIAIAEKYIRQYLL